MSLNTTIGKERGRAFLLPHYPFEKPDRLLGGYLGAQFYQMFFSSFYKGKRV